MAHNQQTTLIAILLVFLVGLTAAVIATMGERPFTSPGEEFKRARKRQIVF